MALGGYQVGPARGRAAASMRPYIAIVPMVCFIMWPMAVLSFAVCATNANQLGSLTMAAYATQAAKPLKMEI